MTAQIAHAPAETRTPATAAACTAAAWDCQMHTYMGSPELVATNLAAVPNDLVERRVYMLTIQGEGRATAHVFERFSIEDTEGTVASWADTNLGDMITQITDVLVTNAGVHCPGEQVKAQLEGEREFVVGNPAPAPKTAAEAFGPAIAEYKNDRFVHATVMAFC